MVAVEGVGESLEVDTGRVERPADVVERATIDVSGGVHQMQKRALATTTGDFAHVLDEDHRLDVGAGDRVAAVAFGAGHRIGGRQRVVVGLLRPGLRGLPVEAGLAVQVAAGSGQRQRLGAGQHVIEGLLLHRIDVDRAGVAVGDRPEGSVDVLPHAAAGALAGVDLAEVWTELAADPPPGEPRKIGGFPPVDQAFLETGRRGRPHPW